MAEDRASLEAKLNELHHRIAPLQAALRVLVKPPAETLPYTRRFVNLAIIEAIRKYLDEEAFFGATEEDIIEALIVGGRSINCSQFNRDAKNSIKRSLRRGILIREGNLIKLGAVTPAFKLNRHKKKQLE